MKKHPFVSEMTGFDRVANEILTRIFKYRDIVKDIDGKPSLYLRRFYLWSRKNKGGAIFLHHIVRSDNDRHLHDHPWAFTTLCLRGGYVETWASGEQKFAFHKHWFSPFQILRNEAEHAHRVTLFHDAFSRLPTVTTWTIVSVSKAHRTWGFWVDGKHVDWRTYLGLPMDTPDSPEDV